MVVRKHTKGVFPLEDFQAKHILTPEECAVLKQALFARQTILIAGATHTAKTSIVNSLLHELRESEERIVICEESPELIFTGPDVAFLSTVDADGERPGIDLRALCRDVLRLSPDRVIVGEVRGGECLEMLKIFDTGHPGISTIHAESARTPTHEACARQLDEQIDAFAKFGFYSEIELSADRAAAPTPIGKFVECLQGRSIDGVIGEPRPFFEHGDPIFAPPGRQRPIDFAEQLPQLPFQRQNISEVDHA